MSFKQEGGSKIKRRLLTVSNGRKAREREIPPDYGYGPVVSIRVPSWTDFFSLLQNMQYGEWFFRGHENSSWKLRTGLDRVREAWAKRYKKNYSQDMGDGILLRGGCDFRAYENKKPYGREFEFAGIAEFRSLTKGRFDASFTNLDYLGAMQHYGSRTRLLDFTFSPFIATFFAFENEEVFSERAIYAINVNRLRGFSPIMGAVEEFLKREDGRDLPKFAEEKLLNNFGDSHPSSWEVYRAIANMDIGRLDDDALDHDDIIPIVLEGGNNRLIAQDGLFLLPLTFDYFDNVLAKMLGVSTKKLNVKSTSKDLSLVKENEIIDLNRIIQDVTLVKFLFDTKMNDSAHQMLRQMNLSDRVIYPDLVGIARSINGIREDAVRMKR